MILVGFRRMHSFAQHVVLVSTIVKVNSAISSAEGTMCTCVCKQHTQKHLFKVGATSSTCTPLARIYDDQNVVYDIETCFVYPLSAVHSCVYHTVLFRV